MKNLQESDTAEKIDLIYPKKLIKHVSLITSIIILVFLSSILTESSYLYQKVVGNFKIINLFLLAFFLCSTLLAILFSNKIRLENIFRNNR